VEFRRKADEIIRKVRRGKRLILTYRGKPVMRLEPIQEQQVCADDPFYTLDQLALTHGDALTNEEIDEIVYRD
jgi:prevent-host-death family protein